jgi:CRISPR-associated protein (TIGR02584 family)
MNTTLLAVTGLSPAIVTETLWALAMRKPRILPRRVAFVTTMTGAAKIESELFTPRPDWNDLSVWESLRKSLKAGPDELIAEPPHVISMPDPSSGRAVPLDDIRTPAENQAAAEFIFARVWDVVRDKHCHLIASVAGGRKTMGALLHSAVSLIGRENDLITHVLVSAPFDTLWLKLLDLIDEQHDRLVAYRIDARSARSTLTAGTMVCAEKVVCYLV